LRIPESLSLSTKAMPIAERMKVMVRDHHEPISAGALIMNCFVLACLAAIVRRPDREAGSE